MELQEQLKEANDISRPFLTNVLKGIYFGYDLSNTDYIQHYFSGATLCIDVWNIVGVDRRCLTLSYNSETYGDFRHDIRSGLLDTEQLSLLKWILISNNIKFDKKDWHEDDYYNHCTYTEGEKEAVRRYKSGEKHFISSFGDIILVGYGNVDYGFDYPLPNDYIKNIYGTLSWDELIKNKY